LASSKVTVFIKGTIAWAKVLGEPVLNYNKDGKEWTFEVEPDEAGLQKILQNGLADRVKGGGYNIGTKGQHKDRNPFLQLKRTELNKDGEPNIPIRIYDNENNPWDSSKLIGNGSSADVKIDIRDYGAGKKKGVYPVAIRITNHIPYESSEFGGMDGENASRSGKPDVMVDFADELNDEIPM